MLASLRTTLADARPGVAILAGIITLSLAGCGPRRYVPDRARDESTRFAAFVNEVFQGLLDRDPALSLEVERSPHPRQSNGRPVWPDPTDAAIVAEQAMLVQTRRRLGEFSVSSLNTRGRAAHRFLESEVEARLADFDWRFHTSPVGPERGPHITIGRVLELQPIEDEADVRLYIDRLQRVGRYTAALERSLEERAQRGFLLPRHGYEVLVTEYRRFLADTPDALLEDFASKLAGIERPLSTRASEYVRQVRDALDRVVLPAFESLIATLDGYRARAGEEVGAWRLPDGEAFYAYRLRRLTTLELAPDEAHRLGQREVRLARQALQQYQRGLGGEQDLEELFARLRSEPELTYPPDAAGTRAFEADVQRYVAQINAQLDEFITPTDDARAPAGSLAVVPSSIPKFRTATAVHREITPGRRLRSTLLRSQPQLSPPARWIDIPVSEEGWSQYAEQLAGELALGSELGRLTARLWHAALVVVDTGIHFQRWSRERAIVYLADTTPRTLAECSAAVDRVIFAPAHAVAGLVGRRRLEELRERAEQQLQRKFNRARFHDMILRAGPLPLDALEDVAEAWIDAQDE